MSGSRRSSPIASTSRRTCWRQRDVFLTDDRPLLVMCRRFREEHDIAIEAMSSSDYLARRKWTWPGGEPNV